MNPTLKNWFRVALWLGLTYAFILAGLTAFGAEEDITIPFAQVAGLFLWTALIGEVTNLILIVRKARKAEKAQAS